MSIIRLGPDWGQSGSEKRDSVDLKTGNSSVQRRGGRSFEFALRIKEAADGGDPRLVIPRPRGNCPGRDPDGVLMSGVGKGGGEPFPGSTPDKRTPTLIQYRSPHRLW